ncbi:Fibronectin domain-containing protein [Oryctes borbonicus]|uniref:Fibronectin domain-containing protein n=1 Tax=Oryctes borbonicus TaxID=1629725 RepID=A0A0T6BAJ0_9SCAR|nr:Fibronectin domain-containing protein [Oryctes borbonicus]
MYVGQNLYIPLLLLPTIYAGTTKEDIKQFAVDVGSNLTLRCPIENTQDIIWVREGKIEDQIKHTMVQNDGSLFLETVTKNDSGIYGCLPENTVSQDLMRSIKVFIKTPPPALFAIVHPSTILALLIWEVNGTGGYPITHFTAEYRLYTEDNWRAISPNNMSPNLRRIEVYKLEPNTTYAFRIWAVNQLGKGDITEIVSTTLHNYTEIELARHLLEGAETFDTRIWIIAVAIVMGTLTILGLGTCFLLYQECKMPGGKS